MVITHPKPSTPCIFFNRGCNGCEMSNNFNFNLIPNIETSELAKAFETNKVRESIEKLFDSLDESNPLNNTSLKLAQDIIKSIEDARKAQIELQKQQRLVLDTNRKQNEIIKENGNEIFLNYGDSIAYLNKNSNEIYNISKLKDLARIGKVTPCFFYRGYVGYPKNDLDNTLYLYSEHLSGYFTFASLSEQIDKEQYEFELPNHNFEDGIKIFKLIERKTSEFMDGDDGLTLFTEKPKDLEDSEFKILWRYYDNEVRFCKSDLDNVLLKHKNQESNFFENTLENSESIALQQLKNENEILKSENENLKLIMNDSNKNKEHEQQEINDKSQDYKLITMMALLLAEKAGIYKRGEKPNAQQIGEAVSQLAIDLGVDVQNIHGLKEPSQKIRFAINKSQETILTLKSQIKS